MKILIIGSNGFVGSHCVDYFAAKGDDVWCAGVHDLQKPKYFKLDRENTNFKHLFQSQVYDVCINATGSANVGFSFENPSKDFELNVINVQKLLVAIRDYNSTCKFINFSSAAVYGNPQILPITETAYCKPLSPYGFHKLQSELLLTEYHNFFNLKTCSLRVFSAYGPRLKKQLFWDLYQKAIISNEISLFGTGKETRDFIYIDDLLQIIDLIIQYSPFEGSMYNASSNVEVTIDEAAKTFAMLFNQNKKITFNGEIKIGDPLNWLANIEQVKNMGFVPQYNLKSGLKKYIQWLKENE